MSGGMLGAAEAERLVAEMAEVVQGKRQLKPETQAFSFLFNRAYGSALLRRARAVMMGEDPSGIAVTPYEAAFLEASGGVPSWCDAVRSWCDPPAIQARSYVFSCDPARGTSAFAWEGW